MTENVFRNCADSITESDMNDVVSGLGYSLPDSFRKHYFLFNGGNPVNKIFKLNDDSEPLEVVGFYPIKYNTPAFETVNSLLLEHYIFLVGKNIIPKEVMPFAHDPGGNFFCLNLENGNVIFYATDSFDPELSPQDNQKRAQLKISDSFDIFMNSLEFCELDSLDEWPED